MSILKSFIIAFSIYSKVPVPQFKWKDEDMRYTLCFFPLIGALIGGLLWGWMQLCVYLEWNRLSYVLMGTAIPLLVTGGFHVDGFMDTMDAFHSYQDREKKLEILKDSHIGAFSVIMLIVYGLLYMAGFAGIDSEKSFAVICAGFCLSRILSGISVLSFPHARPEGMLAYFAESSRKNIVKFVLYVEFVICSVLMGAIQIQAAVCVELSAILVFLYYRYKCLKELGGITGDCAGCFVMICETAMMMAAAVSCMIW